MAFSFLRGQQRLRQHRPDHGRNAARDRARRPGRCPRRAVGRRGSGRRERRHPGQPDGDVADRGQWVQCGRLHIGDPHLSELGSELLGAQCSVGGFGCRRCRKAAGRGGHLKFAARQQKTASSSSPGKEAVADQPPQVSRLRTEWRTHQRPKEAAATRSILERGGAGGSQFPGRRRKVWDRNPLTTCSATPDAQGTRGVQDRSARQQCPRSCAEAQNNGRINTAAVARFHAADVFLELGVDPDVSRRVTSCT